MTTLQEKPIEATPSPAVGARRLPPLRPHVIGSVFRRDVVRYFSNPTGYVFIVLFVFVCALAEFWQQAFFTRNLANLDPLNEWMPYLLLFFIPAITMSTWAEERRQGTDELLLTLPARDVEVVLGKYLAALGIYSVALAFTTILVGFLAWLGTPDLGVMAATYLGYWLMGAMLIAVGMVASLCSSNATVAFILGALFCAVPVFAHLLGVWANDATRRLFEDLSAPSQFHDFGTGVVPLAGVFYFAALAAGMLYVNMVLLGRRHWAGGEASATRWVHSAVRVVSVGLALGSLCVLVGRIGARWDASAEQIHALSAESRALIRRIPRDRPVYIQAYFSPDVPRDYVQVKTDLINKLKEYAALGGNKIRLNLVETPLYSNEAREAQKRFGIEPKRIATVDGAKQSMDEVFLGVAFTSGPEEVVVPFFDRGLPVEYELTRSIRVVSRAGRKRVGVLNTDARLLGGFDFHSMGQANEWPIVTELKKQYEVTSVSADETIPGDFDVLLVAQPSSLTQRQIDNLTAYVRAGNPTLMFLDPLPIVRPQLSPEIPRQSPGGPFGGGPPPEPKGNLRPLLDLMGVEWPTTEVVWNPYNPHRQIQAEPEIVFISPSSGAEQAFNPKQNITSGLQEVVYLFPGLLRSRAGAGPDFIPLVETNEDGGVEDWNDIIEQGFLGMTGIKPYRSYIRSRVPYTLAARIQGLAADSRPTPDPAAKDAKANDRGKDAEIRAILIADLDLISDVFFDLRRQGNENFNFDNVTFVLNCVDVLAGDEEYIKLRKRRTQHRTLWRFEAASKTAIEKSQDQVKEAEEEAKAELRKAQERLDEKVKALEARKDLDERTKLIMLDNLKNTENRRLDVQKANIEDDKRRKIQDIRAEEEQTIRQVQNRIRVSALTVAPLPALVLGLIVFGVRRSRENRGANPNRLA